MKLCWFCHISANERVVIDFSENGKNPGFVPDGLTIDTEGNLYVTTFGGGNIYKVDPKWVFFSFVTLERICQFVICISSTDKEKYSWTFQFRPKMWLQWHLVAQT